MNILWELFAVFFKLGAFTIGGGIAMLPLLQNTLINEKKWFTKEEFVDIVAVCQSLPGVVAINMATYVGYKKKGLPGSIVSTFGVTVPSFVMILIIARFISSLGDNSIAMGAMAGLRAAALGLVAVAIIQLAPAAIKSRWAMLAAALAFVLIGILNVNTAYVILLFMVLGVAGTMISGRKAAEAAKAADSDAPAAETVTAGDAEDGSRSEKAPDNTAGDGHDPKAALIVSKGEGGESE